MFNKSVFWILLAVSFSAMAETDTLLFKLRSRIQGYPNDVRNFDIQIDNENTNPEDYSFRVKADLQGDAYNNVWLWETYHFRGAEKQELISPKLPAGCKFLNLWIANVMNSKSDFQMALYFRGQSCVALRETLAKEKIKVLFTNIPVYQENRKQAKLYMQIDDLHHQHLPNTGAMQLFANFVNDTNSKTQGTYVSYDFLSPSKFDSCKEISVFETMIDLSDMTSNACGLKKSCDSMAMISALGEMGDRIGELADPTGLNKIKRCTLDQQYLSPAPRNGLLKNASSVFYFSLTNEFKMLMQTNVKK